MLRWFDCTTRATGACSLMLAGGVPIEIVQMILGHSTPDMTRKVCAHLMRKATALQVETASGLLTQHRRKIAESVAVADPAERAPGAL